MATHDRADLAAMFARVTRQLGEAETPLLAAGGLSMWEYIALSQLVRAPAPSQLTLARTMRYDKTRLIALLDGLEERGLIARARVRSDRRSQTVAITSGGRRLQRSVQSQIRTMEDEVLSELTATERRSLLTALSKLSASD